MIFLIFKTVTMWNLRIHDERNNMTQYERPTKEACGALLAELNIRNVPMSRIEIVEVKKFKVYERTGNKQNI